MESKVKESMPQITDDTPGMITTTSNVPTDEPAWREYLDVVTEFISESPEIIGDFFSTNQKFLVNLGVLVGAIITVYLTLYLLDGINHIPLLSPILELVGVGYSVWFVSRYLLKESTRDELVTEFKSLKDQLLGGGTGN